MQPSRTFKLIVITTLALLAACSPAPQQSSPADANSFSRYTDLAAGFAVDYPKGWRQWQDKKTGEFMFAASDAPGADHCWVFAERVPPAWMSGAEATLGSINIQLYLIKRHREAQHDQLVDDHRSPLNGNPARHFTVHFDAPLKQAQVSGPPGPVFPFATQVTFTHAQGRPFVLGCTGRRDTSDISRLAPVVERLRASFKPMR